MTPAPHEPHQHAHHEKALAPVEPIVGGGADRIRVVEVLATGSNGGAQEHLYSLVTRMDRSRFETSVVSLSPGSAVRKLQRAGMPALVIDDPDDAIAVGALAAWRVPEERLPRAFDFMFQDDPFSGHVVIRTADAATVGSNYRLWTTLKVPQGYSIEKHAGYLAEQAGAEAFRLMPAKALFALGVGHTRRNANQSVIT